MTTSHDLIAAFLREAAPEHFCATCLAFHADVSLAEARQVVGELAQTGAFVLAMGECDGCARQVSVLGVKR